jgi:hypothetical protein
MAKKPAAAYSRVDGQWSVPRAHDPAPVVATSSHPRKPGADGDLSSGAQFANTRVTSGSSAGGSTLRRRWSQLPAFTLIAQDFDCVQPTVLTEAALFNSPAA